jgi:hypothetical protein
MLVRALDWHSVLMFGFKLKCSPYCLLINPPPTFLSAAGAALRIRVKCRDVIESDLFAGIDVTQGHKEDVAVGDFHVGVRIARVIDVVSAVSAAAAVDTPTPVYCADSQQIPLCTPIGLGVCDPLTRILGNLTASAECNGRETPLAIDGALSNFQAGRDGHNEK